MHYRLFIDGTEAILSDNTIITLNKEKLDFDNLSAKRIEWSNTITLPVCEVNSSIFSNADKSNSIVSILGQKQQFELYLGNSLINRGYCKLVSCNDSGFSVNLYGKLGDILGDLIYINDDSSDKLTLESVFKELVKTYILIEKPSDMVAIWSYLDASTTDIPIAYRWAKDVNFALFNDGYRDSESGFDCKSIIMPVQNAGALYSVSHSDGTKDGLFIFGYDESGNEAKNITSTYSAQILSTQEPSFSGSGMLGVNNELSCIQSRSIPISMLRPVARVKYILSKIGEYIKNRFGVELDIRTQMDDYWCSLPIIDDPNFSGCNLYELFKGTCSPGEFLISIAKITASDIELDINNNKIVIKPFVSGYDYTSDLKVLADSDVAYNVNNIYSELVFSLKDNTSYVSEQYKNKSNNNYGSLVYKYNKFNTTKKNDVFSDLVFTQAVDVYPYIGRVSENGALTALGFGQDNWSLFISDSSDESISSVMSSSINVENTDKYKIPHLNRYWTHNDEGLFCVPVCDSTTEDGKYKAGNEMMLLYYNGLVDLKIMSGDSVTEKDYYMYLLCAGNLDGKYKLENKVPYVVSNPYYTQDDDICMKISRIPSFCSGRYSWNLSTDREYSLARSASFGVGTNNLYTKYWESLMKNCIQSVRTLTLKAYVENIQEIFHTVFNYKNNQFIVTKVNGYNYQTKEATLSLIEKNF